MLYKTMQVISDFLKSVKVETNKGDLDQKNILNAISDSQNCEISENLSEICNSIRYVAKSDRINNLIFACAKMFKMTVMSYTILNVLKI